jgi:hypothetical protein
MTGTDYTLFTHKSVPFIFEPPCIKHNGDVATEDYMIFHGRPRRRWEDNIKMDLQEVGCGGMDWIELALDRDRWGALVSAVMNLRVE